MKQNNFLFILTVLFEFSDVRPCKKYQCFGIAPVTPSPPSPSPWPPSPTPGPGPSPSPPPEPEPEPDENTLLLQVGLGVNFINLFSICSKKLDYLNYL